MPLHVGSFDRRRLLSAGVSAGIGILTDGAVRAVGLRAGSGSTWALLSDTHVAGDLGKMMYGSCMAANVRKAVAEIVERDAGDSGVIVNGDCAHLFGKGGDYRSFASLIEPLAAGRRDLHLLMGNHDDRIEFTRACSGSGGMGQPIAGKRVGFLESPHANWFLLDSLEEGQWTAGEIGQTQLAWLSTMLDHHVEKPAIVMAHHHLHLTPDGGKDRRHSGALRDSGALFDLLQSRRQVKAYVYGHTHQWGIAQSRDGLYFLNLPPAGYVFDSRQPGGWVEATLRSDGMAVELRASDATHPDHGVRHFLKWRA